MKYEADFSIGFWDIISQNLLYFEYHFVNFEFLAIINTR